MYEVNISLMKRSAHPVKASTAKTLACLATLLLLVFYASPLHAQTAPTTAAARGETIRFQSKLVGKTLPYDVYLPADYAAPATRMTHYPIIYLLHGLGGHYNVWPHEKLADYATEFRLIIVTPEGNDGWYTDSATMPADKYESYFLRELIPDVERRYRALATRDGRAVAGLSMGGYGALKFGVKHPDMFAFAASMSGALDAAAWTEEELKGAVGAYVARSVMRTFGAPGNETRATNDIYKMFRELPAERIVALPYFYLDCGTEDFLLQFSRRLARKIFFMFTDPLFKCVKVSDN
jgi:S-formylglutathione hydrolase FrmB